MPGAPKSRDSIGKHPPALGRGVRRTVPAVQCARGDLTASYADFSPVLLTLAFHPGVQRYLVLPLGRSRHKMGDSRLFLLLTQGSAFLDLLSYSTFPNYFQLLEFFFFFAAAAPSHSPNSCGFMLLGKVLSLFRGV